MDFNYILPDWDFVGGSVQSRSFQLMTPTGKDYNIESGTVHCSICDYVNGGDPVVTKQAGIAAAGDGVHCIANIALQPADTKNLHGLYLYQLTVKDGNGNTAIPM